MKKDYVKKGLAIGIILLFIGAGVYPAIAVKLNTSSTNTIDKVENKDISISDISNFNLDRLNLLMFFSMKPKLFTSMIKSYSKTSDYLCKLSSKDCLEIVDKMVKEKLSMTLNALKIIKSKGLIDSSKINIDFENLCLKISEILSRYNESTSAVETQSGSPIICSILGDTWYIIESTIYSIELIIRFTDSDFVRNLCTFIEINLYILLVAVTFLEGLFNCFYYPSDLLLINCFEGENHE